RFFVPLCIPATNTSHVRRGWALRPSPPLTSRSNLVLQAVASGDLAEPAEAGLGRAHEGLAVHGDQAEGRPVAAGPLVVVQRAPVLVCAHVDAVRDGPMQSAKRTVGVRHTPSIVSGGDAVLGDENWGPAAELPGAAYA